MDDKAAKPGSDSKDSDARPDEMALLRREEEVAILTLNYPAKRNALCLQMRQQLVAHLKTLMADPHCRAIVLTGQGGHFCAGGDISEMKQRTLLENRNRWKLVTELVSIMVTGPKPIIAAVEGNAFGAGLSLTANCDYAVAGRSARFGAAFARMAVLPDGGALWSVPRKIGMAKAREIFSLARQFDAVEAERIGLVNAVAEPGEALTVALAVAREYAAMPPLATALLKDALAQGIDTFADALRAETDFQTQLLASRDHREAVTAFLEKRSPNFTGE